MVAAAVNVTTTAAAAAAATNAYSFVSKYYRTAMLMAEQGGSQHMLLAAHLGTSHQ